MFLKSHFTVGVLHQRFFCRSRASSHMLRSSLALSFTYLIAFTSFAQPAFFDALPDSAMSLTKQTVSYDPSYFSIGYPMGDVPADKGVCTDVIIRAYRKMGIDLQKEVHDDMAAHFSSYPKIWGLSRTDKNIDHRRVPNLMIYFQQQGAVKPTTPDAKDYLPGDIVCWNLGGAVTHIGIVVKAKSADRQRNLIVHNIGGGQVIEDCLFNFVIIGHYRFAK
jgi:uncharacterized protein YijF (DUF1287 family)